MMMLLLLLSLGKHREACLILALLIGSEEIIQTELGSLSVRRCQVERDTMLSFII